MPIATTKTELILVTEGEYAKLRKLAQALDARVASLAPEGTSIKDVLGHRAYWILLFLGWYHDGQAGKDVHFPAKGYSWADLRRFNAHVTARHKDLSWTEAQTLLDHRHGDLMTFLHRLSGPDLYGAPMQGAKNGWTTGRWAEAAAASRYRSAAKFIRAVLRDAPPER